MGDLAREKRRIFIAYFNRDTPMALELHRALAAAGHEPWCDRLDLLPGDLWMEKTLAHLRMAHIILVLVSPGPVTAWYEWDTIALAVEHARLDASVRIVPVELDGATRDDTPYGLGALAALHIRRGLFDHVLEGIARLAETRTAPDRSLPGVFVSYFGPDRSRAVHLRHALEALPCHPWCDAVDLLPGDIWAERIQSRLRAAHVLIVLVSQNAHDGWYARTEVSDAIESARANVGRRIVPILLDEATREDLPYGLKGLRVSRVHGHDFGPVLHDLKRILLQLASELSEPTDG